MKKILVALFIIAVLIGIIERNVIFQEGNPLPVAFGILRLSVTGESIVKISSNPEKYILKNKDGYNPYVRHMEIKGWRYVEQMGAGLVFEKNGEKHISVSRMYTRFYRIIRY